MKKWMLVLLALAAPMGAAEPRIRVTESAGLARSNEPVRIELDGREDYIFVTVGANQTREYDLSDVRPSDPLEVRYAGPTGFTLQNAVLKADHAERVLDGRVEDSGSLNGLTYKPFDLTLRRTENRMHWAPSFQREGVRGYTSIATWDPVQRTERKLGAGWFVHTREGGLAQYPEIDLWAEYRYFAHVPYFLFHAVTNIVEPIQMYWLRAQEMTMDAFFTHVVFPGSDGKPALYDFEARKAVLEKSPLPADIPWLAFVNLDKGYGFGAVTLGYSATTAVGAHMSINDGANNGKYWDRRVVDQKATPLKPGDRYEEQTAYVLFRVSRQAPVAELLEWEKRLRAPLQARVLSGN